MKMETTLAAEVAGKVARVSAAPGALVDAGDVLVDIEAAPSA
jgi:biotin carboxyl carrier protein